MFIIKSLETKHNFIRVGFVVVKGLLDVVIGFLVVVADLFGVVTWHSK
jgi:hypothetical protein